MFYVTLFLIFTGDYVPVEKDKILSVVLSESSTFYKLNLFYPIYRYRRCVVVTDIVHPYSNDGLLDLLVTEFVFHKLRGVFSNVSPVRSDDTDKGFLGPSPTNSRSVPKV